MPLAGFIPRPASQLLYHNTDAFPDTGLCRLLPAILLGTWATLLDVKHQTTESERDDDTQTSLVLDKLNDLLAGSPESGTRTPDAQKEQDKHALELEAARLEIEGTCNRICTW